MDEDALDLPKNKVDTPLLRKAAWAASRDTVADRAVPTPQRLATDFLHFLFVDENGMAGGSGAVTNLVANQLQQRSSIIAVSDLKVFQVASGLPSFNEMVITTVAHEITHLLFNVQDDPFNMEWHTTADESDLMYKETLKANNELITVKFSAVLQGVLKVKNNQALVL